MKIRKIVKTVIFVALAAVVVAGIGRLSGAMPDFGSLFGKNLSIEDTENIITEIRQLSEFTTACFFEEGAMVEKKYKTRFTPVYKKVESGNKVKDLLGLSREYDGTIRESVQDGQIAYIVRGKVRAGYDLSEIGQESIAVRGDTLSVKLPAVKIFDVIVNPSDISEFDREGQWSEKEINAIIGKAKQTIEKDAVDSGLLDKAQASGREKFEALFKSFGFKVVMME